MKSTDDQLKKRGYLPGSTKMESYQCSYTEKLVLLQSKTPQERTAGARLLKDEEVSTDLIDHLVVALSKESKLYSKIEISATLADCGIPAVKPLINQLGCIGGNQYKKVPSKPFKKKNYPLPRDIAARTLVRIGDDALPELCECMDSAKNKQLSEAIDAIGFICYYSASPIEISQLVNCYEKNKGNHLIQWKLIRAFSSFKESIELLRRERQCNENECLFNEIDRSIELINKRLK
ncbi:hypothetical protein EYV94_02120 [Puteibacter caeruleilacunae]|nr:hypothetical protein EYV94_02120 [Puteibacter caeruleilacunae]